MIFWSSIMERTSTLPNETIHITPKCVVHLHDYQNKMVPFMKLSIFEDLNNDIKFHSYTYWSTNDIRSHHLSCQVSNHHINNKDLVFTNHVEINLITNVLKSIIKTHTSTIHDN
jgi:hypothetical protein